MTSSIEPPAQPSKPHGPEIDPVTGLHRMSTTAGLGSGDYVAISGLAVAAILLGLSSVLALLHPVMLIIPIAAVIFTIMAVVKIRGSNRTQWGIPLALLGGVVAVLVGGYVLTTQLSAQTAEQRDQREVAALVDQLEAFIMAGEFDAAYRLFT